MGKSSLSSSDTPAILPTVVSGWNRFWFTPRSPLTLGLMRIFAGLVVFYVHLVYSADLLAFFGKDAWVNMETMDLLRHDYRSNVLPIDWGEIAHKDQYRPTGWPIFSIFFHVTDPNWVIAIHVIVLVLIVLFTVGFCTRVTSVLVWMGSLSYIQRTPTTLFGLDTMTNILLLYLMIGPSGAALSFDRLIARWRKRKRGEELGPPEPSVSANVAIRLFQIHFCIIYFMSGASKLQGARWWSGNAIWYTVANYSFAPMNSALYLDVLKLISSNRWIWEFLMIGGSFVTLFIELSFPYLVWRPRWRWLMICCSVFLHVGIGILMGLGAFSMSMMAMVLCFMPSETIQKMIDTLRTTFGNSASKTAKATTSTNNESALAAPS